MKTRKSNLFVHTTVAAFAALALVGCDRGNDAGQAAGTGTTVGTEIDDATLTASVKTALMADDTVRGLDINVETEKGNVSLNGQVASQAQIDQAVKVARGVSGVRDVDNKLTVREGATAGATGASGTATVTGDSATLGTAADDTAITARVKSALLAESEISSLDISVETTNGVVQLTGDVTNPAQIQKAAQVASAAEGVKSVQNQLKVKQ